MDDRQTSQMDNVLCSIFIGDLTWVKTQSSFGLHVLHGFVHHPSTTEYGNPAWKKLGDPVTSGFKRCSPAALEVLGSFPGLKHKHFQRHSSAKSQKDVIQMRHKIYGSLYKCLIVCARQVLKKSQTWVNHIFCNTLWTLLSGKNLP